MPRSLRRARPAALDFTGWRVVAGGSLVWALQSFVWMQGFGNLAVALREQFGWSKTLFSVSFVARRVEAAVLAPIIGKLFSRHGIGAVMRVGAFFLFVGFLFLASINSKLMFVLAMLVAGLGASFSGFMAITTATVGWFERRRARALSYVSMGFALGGFAGPLLVVLFNLIGWRASMAIVGSAVAAVTWKMAGLLDLKLADTGEPVDGIEANDERLAEPRAEGLGNGFFTAKEAIRTRAFWMIALGHGSALLVVSTSMAHLTLYLTEDRAYSAGRAAIVAGFVPLFQFIGTAWGGQLGDRLNKRLIAAIAMVAHGVGLLLLTYAVHWWMIAAFVVLHGLAWGSRGPQMGALRADYFGTERYGDIMGWSAMIVTVGSIGGPLLAGTLADATGSYRLGFTILAIAALVGTVFWLFATPPTTIPESVTAQAPAEEVRP